MKSLEESAIRYAEKSLMAFLEAGKYAKDRKPKTLAWIIGVIRASGVRGQDLDAILKRLQDYGDGNRYRQAVAECRRQGWL